MVAWILLALSLLSCRQQTTFRGETALSEAVFRTYYGAQEGPAFSMWNKSIFQGLADDWTAELGQPKWENETFAEYVRLNGDLAPIDQGETLYSCAFSTDDHRYGYVVMAYHGNAISHIETVETPSLYDLQAKEAAVTEALGEMELDESSVGAVRVRVETESGPGEGIRITDRQGNALIYYFQGIPA